MSNIPEFTLSSNNIIEYGSFHVTNSVMASFAVSITVVIIALLSIRKAGVVPTRGQLFIEMIVDFFLGMLRTAYGSEKRARKYLSYTVTLFLFLLVANQFSGLPIVASITAGDGPLFRTATSDWSQTIALALISLGSAHLIAFTSRPWKHINNFIKIEPFFKIRKPSDIGNAFLEFFLGILDIVGEFAKLMSMSARLFGNLFAGEVLIAVIAGITIYTSFVVPVPFMALSIFSGLVQAFVFTLLAIQFMAATVLSVPPSQSDEASDLKTV